MLESRVVIVAEREGISKVHNFIFRVLEINA